MSRGLHTATFGGCDPGGENAVNDTGFFLEQAARFRRLAHDILDAEAERALLALAAEYEARAAAVQGGGTISADGGAASGGPATLR